MFSVSGLPRMFFFARQALVYDLLFYKCIYRERAMAELLVILTSITLKQPEMLKIIP